MKKNRRPIKRIIFALLACFVLVPVLSLSLFAYPTQEYIPANEFIEFGGASLPVYETNVLATCDYSGLEVGDSYAVTFADIGIAFNDNSYAWQYISFQLDVIVGNVSIGHYTAGFYREYSGSINYRLGRTELYNITGSSYPVMAELPSDTKSVMVGISIEKETNGRPNIRVELVALDSNGLVIETAAFVEVCPAIPETFTYRGKTEYARVNTAAVINDTTDYPHMPFDLVSLSLLTNKAYDAGFDDGEVDGYAVGYDTAFKDGSVITKTIWDIISMPFDIVANILNFDILGLNLWTLVAGVFTVVIVFWVLKKVGVV